MTAYFNPHTRKLETPEEMGERPADSETVLPVGDLAYDEWVEPFLNLKILGTAIVHPPQPPAF